MLTAMATQKRETRQRRKQVKAEAMRRYIELGGTLTMSKIKRRQDRLMQERLRADFNKWRDS